MKLFIDEAFLVPGPEIKDFEEAAIIELTIKEESKRQERITCSEGFGLNKIIAKIASKVKKPAGLQLLDFKMSKSFFSV